MSSSADVPEKQSTLTLPVHLVYAPSGVRVAHFLCCFVRIVLVILYFCVCLFSRYGLRPLITVFNHVHVFQVDIDEFVNVRICHDLSVTVPIHVI